MTERMNAVSLGRRPFTLGFYRRVIQEPTVGGLIQGELIMLKVHTKNLGNVSVLALQGRIIKGETASLRDAVRSQSKVNAVVLDLARVSAVDASGLGVLLELRKQTEAKGIRFRLMNVSNFVNRILEITRLDSVFEVTSGVEVAPAISRAVPLELARCA